MAWEERAVAPLHRLELFRNPRNGCEGDTPSVVVAGVAQEHLLQRLSEAESAVRDQWAGAESPPEGALARAYANENWLLATGDPPFAAAHYPSLRATVVGYNAPAFTFGGINFGLKERDAIAPGARDAVLVSSLRGPGGDYKVALMQVGEDGRPVAELGPNALMVVRGNGRRTTSSSLQSRSVKLKPDRRKGPSSPGSPHCCERRNSSPDYRSAL